jgi:hypothetical protein
VSLTGGISGSASGGEGGQHGDEFEATIGQGAGGIGIVTGNPANSQTLAGGSGQFDGEPATPGLGGGGAISNYAFYDNNLSAGGGGNGGQPGANGDSGIPGVVRVVFLGDFELQRNLRSYFRTTTGGVVTTPTIVVPTRAANNSVPTSNNISIGNFENGSADEFIDASFVFTPPDQPVTTASVSITWDNDVFSARFINLNTGLSGASGVQTVTISGLSPNTQYPGRLVRRGASGTPQYAQGTSCNTTAIVQSGGTFDFNATTAFPVNGQSACGVVFETIGVSTTVIITSVSMQYSVVSPGLGSFTYTSGSQQTVEISGPNGGPDPFVSGCSASSLTNTSPSTWTYFYTVSAGGCSISVSDPF